MLLYLQPPDFFLRNRLPTLCKHLHEWHVGAWSMPPRDDARDSWIFAIELAVVAVPTKDTI
jgi:hypothetical protein